MKRWFPAVLAMTTMVLVGCGSTSDSAGVATPDVADTPADVVESDDIASNSDGDADSETSQNDTVESDAASEPDVTAEPDTSITGPDGCDPSRPPIVLAHGLLAAGDTWAPHAMRFMANGWCRSHLIAFDWDTLGSMGDPSGAVPLLDATIDKALADTGATKVVLVGHSAGGGLGYAYLAEPGRAKKVSKYVHVGSGKEATLPGGGTPTMNLWSQGDMVIKEKGDIDGATNVSLKAEDHYGVATSAASFRAMYAFIAGATAATDAIVPTATATVEGRAVAFGSNTPAAGATLDVWEVDGATGERLHDTPEHHVVLGDDAHFGPLAVTPGAHYEFAVGGGAERPVHYFREPFVRSNPFLYLRTLPGPDSGLAGALLSAVPFTKDTATLVAYGSSHAFIDGDSSLTLDGTELLSPTLASPEKTLIGLFLYDGADTAEGDLIDLLPGFPFLSARDTTLAAPGSSVFVFDGRTLAVHRFAGDPDGAVIASFD